MLPFHEKMLLFLFAYNDQEQICCQFLPHDCRMNIKVETAQKKTYTKSHAYFTPLSAKVIAAAFSLVYILCTTVWWCTVKKALKLREPLLDRRSTFSQQT